MLNNQPQSHLSLQEIQNTSPQEKPRRFLQYCREIIAAKNRGELLVEDAAYKIAGAMTIHELEEPLFVQITELAGSLELPYYISGIHADTGWKKLEQLVNEYDQRLHEK